MFAKLVTLTALLAAATSVQAVGKAIVKNQCSYPVYLWSVSNTVGDMQTMKTGDQYSETYRANPNGGGISIKLSSVDQGLYNGAAITQFEYTLDTTIWYDISNINGYPFVAQGLTVVPSESSCPSIVCAAGVRLCSAVYNIPTDDFATADCSNTADIVLVLCADQVASTPAYSVSSVASVAIASASRASTATTTSSTSSATSASSSSTVKVSSSSVSAFSNPFVSVSVNSQSSTTFIVASATTSGTPVAIVSAQATTNSNSAVYTTLVTHIVTVGGASTLTSTVHATTASTSKSITSKAASTTVISSSSSAPAPTTTAAPTSTTADHWWIGHHPISWDGTKARRHNHHRHAERNA